MTTVRGRRAASGTDMVWLERGLARGVLEPPTGLNDVFLPGVTEESLGAGVPVLLTEVE